MVLLGIGATTSVFSWIQGILLRPYPMVANQDRMVAITGIDRTGRTDVSWPDLQDLQRNCSLVGTFIATRRLSAWNECSVEFSLRAENSLVPLA